jgi:hypothetical protein
MMGWGAFVLLKGGRWSRESEKQAEISLTSAAKFLWITFAGTGSSRLRRVMIATPAIFGGRGLFPRDMANPSKIAASVI